MYHQEKRAKDFTVYAVCWCRDMEMMFVVLDPFKIKHFITLCLQSCIQ